VRAFLSAPRADGLALIAGAFLPLAFAPIGFFPLAVFTPAVLFLLWLEVTPRRALWRGFLFGVGVNAVGVSWVYVAIHDFGYAPVPLAVSLTALFVAFLAVYPALLGWLAVRFLRTAEWLRLALLFPAAWVLMEWLRGWLFTGFPWLNLGYSQIDSPLRGFAPLLGAYGVSLATVLAAGLLATLVVTRGRARAASAALLVALFAAGAGLSVLRWTAPSAPPLSVALVQGNVPQDTKWRPELVQHTLDLYAGLTRQHWDSRLILWPEAAITAFYHEVAGDYLPALAAEARRHGSSIVLGIPVLDRPNRRMHNSLVSLGEHPGLYHKRHLVPFGDFVPFEAWLRGLLGFFDLPMSGFSPGPAEQPLLEAAGEKLASAICYEDIFGEELIAALPQASLLVNATNNAWYGNSFAPHQHLEMSRFRALETGRYMLRVTTNGVSAIIRPDGQVAVRSRQFQTEVVTGTAVPHAGDTPYVRLGNTPLIGLSAVLLLVVGRGWRLR
jgi:apolipoprotein N-acyltransferase